MNVIKRAFLACAVILLALVTPASACSDAEKKRIQVELDGIEALRKVGIAGISLNALRGVCVPVRSLEGSVKWIIEPVIKKAIELLKDQGIDLGDVDVHVFSAICENVHYYTDEFAVGRRERELKEKLAQCK